MNWHLINCAFGNHKYGNIIKDEISDEFRQFCKYCGHGFNIKTHEHYW